MSVRLVVGDIHGCFDEFCELLDRAGLADGDEVLAVGDLVDRGPDSVRVVDFFRDRAGTQSVIGNHERKHVRSFRNEVRPALSQRITKTQFGPDAYREACSYFASLPRHRDLPEALVVHAFWEPGVALEEQKDVVLVGTIRGEHYLKERHSRPWYELYDGSKPLIVGHHDYLGTGEALVWKDRVFGLDTGVYVGGALTGLLLPEFRLISVPGRRNYWVELKEQYSDLRYEARHDEQLNWEKLEQFLEGTRGRADLSPPTRERREHLEERWRKAQEALRSLVRHVEVVHDEILARVRAEGPFDDLPPSQQGRRYAVHAKGSPLATFLHLQRQGRFDERTVRTRFKKPAELLRFCERIGLRTGPPET